MPTARHAVIAVALAMLGRAHARAADPKPPGTPDYLAIFGSTTAEVDLDGDGKVDTWRTYDDGCPPRLRAIAYDNDGDGKVDEKVVYEDARNVRLVSWHHNGVFDERTTETFAPDDRDLLERTVIEHLWHGRWVVVEARDYRGAETKITYRDARGRTRVRYESSLTP